jgi:hypothetical protein
MAHHRRAGGVPRWAADAGWWVARSRSLAACFRDIKLDTYLHLCVLMVGYSSMHAWEDYVDIIANLLYISEL